MNSFSRILKRPEFQLLFALTVIECAVLVLAVPRIGILQFEPKLQLVAIFIIAGFGITLFQLAQSQVVQRAKFLSDYLSRIHTDKELSSAFHDLVATYEDRTFDMVTAQVTEYEMKLKYEKAAIARPVFQPLESLQGQRIAGQRYYHPLYFQGSEEERKLDGLLGYLDVVGYHHYHGLIRTKDIVAMLNYHLAALASRKVINTYLTASGESWFSSTSIQQNSSAQTIPYLYLRHMLGEYIIYNEKNAAMMKGEQEKIAKKLRGRFL